MLYQVPRMVLSSGSMLVKLKGRGRTGESGDADAGSSRDEDEAIRSNHRRRHPGFLPGPPTRAFDV